MAIFQDNHLPYGCFTYTLVVSMSSTLQTHVILSSKNVLTQTESLPPSVPFMSCFRAFGATADIKELTWNYIWNHIANYSITDKLVKCRHSSSVIFQLVSTYLSSISCCFFERNPNLTRKFRCFYERLLLETQCFIINCCYGDQRLGLIS